MAKFWSVHKNLVTGDNQKTIGFKNHVYVTNDANDIKLLREKMKIKQLGLSEVTPKDKSAADDVKKAETSKSK